MGKPLDDELVRLEKVALLMRRLGIVRYRTIEILPFPPAEQGELEQEPEKREVRTIRSLKTGGA